MDNKNKIVRSTPAQKRFLVDYMASNPNFAAGQYDEVEWCAVALMLEDHGPKKSVAQWKKTWNDLKRRAMKQGAKVRQASISKRKSVQMPKLSKQAKKILDTIGHKSATGSRGKQETGVSGKLEPLIPPPAECDEMEVDTEDADADHSSTVACPDPSSPVDDDINVPLSNSVNKSRKYCIVPECGNSSSITPYKVFFQVPKEANTRKKWLDLMRRKNWYKSSVYVCEDHFDIEEDMENYIQFKVMGETRLKKLKPGVVPHKFPWTPSDRPFIKKKKEAEKIKERTELVNKLLSGEIPVKATAPVEEIFIVEPVKEETTEKVPDPLETAELQDKCATKIHVCKKCNKKVEVCVQKVRNKGVGVNINMFVSNKSTMVNPKMLGRPIRRKKVKKKCVKEP